jgi:hypothetical protein
MLNSWCKGNKTCAILGRLCLEIGISVEDEKKCLISRKIDTAAEKKDLPLHH